MMKKLLLLLMVAVSMSSCYTTSMKGSPAAVAAGSSIGGVLGSIVGDRAGGWRGSQFGALVGTVAGAAIGNAVTTPRQEKVVVEERYPENAPTEPYYAPSGLRVTNIRFIDDNRNHTIDAGENCKLVFDIVNEGDVSAYNITPIVEEVSGMKHIGISPSAQISYLPQGDKVRYTATIAGGKRLKSGEAVFRVYTTESNGAVSVTQEFSLPTAKR
ncbi:MAG: hypothetical protein IKJ10_04495 [Bacteroidaceae bacterium]|nr:hypothetical protein [Bacteroidaceae bacterium]MBR4043888.1 hypothetical protein [Bacteroidaceae bacterium]